MCERYQNGKIYKLVSDATDDVYYGSTCLPLSKRTYGHKRSYAVYKSNKGKYTTSFKMGVSQNSRLKKSDLMGWVRF